MWKLRRYNLLNRHERPIRRVGNLHKGEEVKLVFELDKPVAEVSAERMWVTIDRIEGKRIMGILDNDPIYLKELKAGDKLEFARQNIYDVYEDSAS